MLRHSDTLHFLNVLNDFNYSSRDSFPHWDRVRYAVLQSKIYSGNHSNLGTEGEADEWE